jgi:hypothetical protein
MNTNHSAASTSGCGHDTYQVQLRGHVDDSWSDWFDGFAVIRQDDGTTMLIGPVIDQAALHGLLARIRDLGLAILSVGRIGESPEGSAPADGGGGGPPP